MKIYVSTAVSSTLHKSLQAQECLAHKFIDQLGAQQNQSKNPRNNPNTKYLLFIPVTWFLQHLIFMAKSLWPWSAPFAKPSRDAGSPYRHFNILMVPVEARKQTRLRMPVASAATEGTRLDQRWEVTLGSLRNGLIPWYLTPRPNTPESSRSLNERCLFKSLSAALPNKTEPRQNLGSRMPSTFGYSSEIHSLCWACGLFGGHYFISLLFAFCRHQNLNLKCMLL